MAYGQIMGDVNVDCAYGAELAEQQQCEVRPKFTAAVRDALRSSPTCISMSPVALALSAGQDTDWQQQFEMLTSTTSTFVNLADLGKLDTTYNKNHRKFITGPGRKAGSRRPIGCSRPLVLGHFVSASVGDG
jgi:hypothetical protein